MLWAGLLVYFSQHWPEMLASGALIPGLQFFSNQLWQLRRRTRLITIRKEIAETEDFLKRYSGTSQDAIPAGILKIYHDQRLEMFAEVQRLSTPFEVSHPNTARVLSFFLISRPKYVISVITRAIFYVALFGLCKALVAFIHNGTGWEVILAASLDAWAFHSLTRIADRPNGPIVSRPWWQRLTLVYGPASGLVLVLHVLYWMTLLACVVEATRYYARIGLFELAGALSFIAGLSAVLIWWFAVHLDREPPAATGMSPATAV